MINPTIKQLLDQATQSLNAFSSARLDAEILLAFVLQKSRSYLFAWPEKKLDDKELQCFKTLVNRRRQGEPVAYITGEKEFYSLQFNVTSATLIPRPETELLVDLVLKYLPKHNIVSILDLGTGSGAISVAIAVHRPHWQITAVDISHDALQLAKLNAKNHSIKNINFIESDWFSQLDKRQFDCIVANPPYIACDDEHLQNAELTFEPKTALVAENNGFLDFERIISGAKKHLLNEGLLMLEHGYNQAETLKKLLLNYGYKNLQTFKDLAHNDRVVMAFPPDSLA